MRQLRLIKMKFSVSASVDTVPEEDGARLSRNVKVLGWVSFFTDVHSESILPLLPLFITQVLGLSETFLGLIEGIAGSTASFLQIFSGWYSDRVRRRKGPTVAGYLLSTSVKPLLAFSKSGMMVLAVRFSDRLGKGIRTAPRDALIAESTNAKVRGRAFGFHRMMDTLGAVAGTTFAYILMNVLSGDEGRKMRTVFLSSTVFGVAAVIILLSLLREKRQEEKATTGTNEGSPRRYPRRLLIFLAINTLFYLGMFSYAFFLLRARSLGVSTAQIPLIYLLYNIVYALVSMPLGSLSDKIGRKPVILLAYGLYAVLCLGIALATKSWQAWMLFVVYGVHSATVNPASRALVSELSHLEARGTALGLYHSSLGIAALPASLAAGVIWDKYGAPAPFLIAGLLSLFALALMLPLSFPTSRADSARN
jgi:MFS family permease